MIIINIKDHKHQKVLEIVVNINHSIMKMMVMILLSHQCIKEYKISKKSIRIIIFNIQPEQKIFDILK